MSARAAVVALALASCAAPPAAVDDAPAPRAEPVEPADLLRRAVSLMDSRRFDRAIAVLNGLLAQQVPADAAATHYLLGSAFAAANDYHEAALHYALAADNPGSMSADGASLARLGAGHYAFLAGRHQDAVRHLAIWRRSAATADPSILMELAQAHAQLGQSAHALEVAEAALREAQAEGQAAREEWLELLAELYRANQRWDETLAMQERLEREFPVRLRGSRELLPDSAALDALQAQTRALLDR